MVRSRCGILVFAPQHQSSSIGFFSSFSPDDVMIFLVLGHAQSESGAPWQPTQHNTTVFLENFEFWMLAFYKTLETGLLPADCMVHTVWRLASHRYFAKINPYRGND